jgi:DNA-binding NarL/FixJ family response regulator
MHLQKTQNAGEGRDRVSVCQVSVLKAVLEHRGFSPKCTKCAANFDVTELIFWLIGSRDSAENILAKLATLTERQHQIMRLVLDGLPSKTIGSDLRISRRTVENHRAAIMKKTGCHSLPALARWMVAAEMAI